MARAAQILIVEDEALIAETIRIQLVQLKHDVIGIAESGDAAIRLAWALNPDLVLMDGTLKGSMDGFETAHIIEQLFDCPIIFVTANPHACTMRYWIPKPFSDAAFTAIVAAALGNKNAATA